MNSRTALAPLALCLLTACREPTPVATHATDAAARPTAAAAMPPGPPEHPGTVTSQRAHELVAAGATLVDVRSPGEYASGHLTGAINIPVEQLWARYREIPPGQVVVYCASGVRSARARRILGAFGPEAFDLGAMSNW